MPTCAPIIFFAYNRPQHTQKALEALRHNLLAKHSDLIIYCDGPKTKDPELLNQIEKVRSICRSIEGFKSVRVVERDENWGLAKSIISGVTEACHREGRVIVVEDDLVTSPHFLKFLNEALEYYRDRKDIAHIQGYVYALDQGLPETFLTADPGSWGWATWADRWKLFESDSSKLLEKINDSYRFDFEGSFKFTEMLRMQMRGELNSWAIRWYGTLFVNNLLAVWPGRSLVQNIGADGTGTHEDAVNHYDVELSPTPITQFTDEKSENLEARRAIIRFFKKNFSFRRKLKRKIRSLFSFNQPYRAKRGAL